MDPIETRVEAVTLYHRGATVRRVGEVACPGGVAPRELAVAGLPLSLVDATVRVKVEALEGKAELTATNVRVGLWAPPRGTPAAPPDLKELKRVQRAIELANDRVSQLEAEVGLLRGIPVPPRPTPEEGKLPPPSPMVARTGLEQLADESVAARVTEIRKVRDEVRKLEEEGAAMLRRLELAGAASQARPDELKKSVHLTLLSSGPVTKLRLSVEYFVGGARWTPAYQCRMSRDCLQAEVQMRAMVCQRTGEDWKGVMLSLSTAAPMSWTELPVLSAIKLGKAQPPPPAKAGFRPPPKGAGMLFADFDRDWARARAELPVVAGWRPPSTEAALPPPRQARDFVEERRLSVSKSAEVYEPEPALEESAMEMDDSGSEDEASIISPPTPQPPASAAPARREVERARAGPSGGARPPAPAPMKKMAAKPMGLTISSNEAQLEVLLYAQLRLGAPHESGSRGRLHPVDRRHAYLESLGALGLSVTVDVLALVAQAEHQGAAVHQLSLPPSTVDVRAAAGNFDYVYRADAAVDVPSDGSFHSVPVGTRTAASSVVYVTVPREDHGVYRQAMVKNPLPSPLLPGPAEVYVAGEYVLTTTLPAVPPGGDFKLGLGVEQAIKVARNTRYQEQRSGDKVVATAELIHDITIELVNNLEREVQCEVRERIPQPAPDAEVVVEEGKVAPPWEAYDQEERGVVLEGGRRWKVTVPAGKTQALAAQYRVKLYANNELAGGNRREA